MKKEIVTEKVVAWLVGDETSTHIETTMIYEEKTLDDGYIVRVLKRVDFETEGSA